MLLHKPNTSNFVDMSDVPPLLNLNDKYSATPPVTLNPAATPFVPKSSTVITWNTNAQTFVPPKNKRTQLTHHQ